MENTNNTTENANMVADLVDGAVASSEKEINEQETSGVQTATFQPLTSGPVNGERNRKLDLLYDLNLPVSIELGRTNMMIKEILDLQRGSIIEFEKLASEPVDILINGKKMAEGEVVIIEKHFGIRITNLVDATERVKGLGK